MLVKHLFYSLQERLQGLEQEWSSGNKENQEILKKELLELRKVSDEILDQWLLFEERVSTFQQIVNQAEPVSCPYPDSLIQDEVEQMSDEVAEKILQEIKKMHKSEVGQDGVVAVLGGEAAHSFRKGQGYYSLFMYTHAAEQFGRVVEQDPDLDIARLFLGFSQMMNGNVEEAEHHFHLIAQTSEQRLIQATSFNAQGCLAAGQEKYEQSIQYFEKACKAYPKLKDSLFNQALAYMKLERYIEANAIWTQYVSEFPDDWEALLQYAKCCRSEGRIEDAEMALTGIVQATEDPEMLWQAGQSFEDMRLFGNAALCYRLLLNLDATKASAWHGLGWNLWHAEGYPVSLTYIKKAIALSPKNPDFQFSYGWILYQMGEWDKAEQVYEHIAQLEENYPLVSAGFVHLYISQGNWKLAEHYCELLSQDSQISTRALGHLQWGRLWLAKGDHRQAEREFQKSLEISSEMKDSHLFLGLIWYLDGQKEKALAAWEHTL